jgi:acyl carrier protein
VNDVALEDRIRAFLTRELLFDLDLEVLGDDDTLLAPGRLDSIGVLRLVSWLEEEFGIQVLDDEVVPENLETVRRLSDMVRRKQAASLA